MKALLFLAVVLALTSTSLATHFRYQTLYWERPTADSKVLTVTLKQAWRWSAFGNPLVGTTISTGTIYWGDGGASSISGVVVSTNAADDWFFHQQVFTKTYSSYGNFTVTFSDCCRISTLKDGNNDRSQVVSTNIVLTNGGALRSPQIASLPLIPFQINQNNSIQLPLIKDEQNNDVTFSITPASASGLNLASPSAAYSNAIFPFALTAGGTIKWNPNTAGLYAFQTTATATNGNAVTLDVILMVSAAQADHSPPYWTAPTQTEVHFTPGQLLTFTVAAKEDEIDDIHVQAGSLPPGATLSGCQGAPVQGRFNPCTTTFSWQTTATSTDTIVCFQANDAVGNYAPQLCVTLIADTSAGTCGPNCVVKTVASSCTDSGNPISHHASGTCATLSFSNTASQC